MILAISGKKTHGKNLLATIIQYHIYCKKMLKLHPTFSYPAEKFFWQITNKPGFGFSVEETGWELKSLAYKLKACLSIILGVPIEKFDDQDYKLTVLPECWDRFFWRDHKNRRHRVERDRVNPDAYEREEMTVRQFMQLFGTEGCRDGVHDNFWVNALMSDYKPTNGEYPLIKGIGTKEEWSKEYVAPILPKWLVTDCRFINEADTFKEHGGLIFRINRNIESNDNHPSETGLDDYMPDALITNDSTILSLIEQTREVLEDFHII